MTVLKRPKPYFIQDGEITDRDLVMYNTYSKCTPIKDYLKRGHPDSELEETNEDSIITVPKVIDEQDKLKARDDTPNPPASLDILSTTGEPIPCTCHPETAILSKSTSGEPIPCTCHLEMGILSKSTSGEHIPCTCHPKTGILSKSTTGEPIPYTSHPETGILSQSTSGGPIPYTSHPETAILSKTILQEDHPKLADIMPPKTAPPPHPG